MSFQEITGSQLNTTESDAIISPAGHLQQISRVQHNVTQAVSDNGKKAAEKQIVISKYTEWMPPSH